MILRRRHGFVAMSRFFLQSAFFWCALMPIHAQRTGGGALMMISYKDGRSIPVGIGEVDSLWFTTLPSSYLLDGASFPSYIRKSVSLKGKRVAFFGDSIMKGHVNGREVTSANFPNLLAETCSLGRCDNYAVAGATYTPALGDVKTVMEQMATVRLANYDVIIIAAGVNDWQLGGDIAKFEAAVKSLCTELSGVDAEVVFITPINCATTSTLSDPVASLQVYRNIIYKVVLEAGKRAHLSVVQGTDFGFPDSQSSSEYVEMMFGDRLHPSELGYRTLYLPGFIRAINTK